MAMDKKQEEMKQDKNKKKQKAEQVKQKKAPGKVKLLAKCCHRAIFNKDIYSKCFNSAKHRTKSICFKIKDTSKAKPVYFVIGGVIIVGVIGLWVFHSFDSHNITKPVSVKSYSYVAPKQSSISVARQMQQTSVESAQQRQAASLKIQLSKIQRELKNANKSNPKINQLEEQVASLTGVIQQVDQNALAAKLAAQKSTQATIDVQNTSKESVAQVAKVEAQVTAIHRQLTPQKYLPASSLPFEVVGSGYWGNKQVVTIAMKDVGGTDHYRLMGLGEQFNCQSFGWRLPNCTNWDLSKISKNPNYVIFTASSNPAKKVKAGF
jgi:hypothetical protein